MKYAVIVTYTTGERTGATVTASGCAAAWDKVFEMFDKADVRGVELAAILTVENSRTRMSSLRPSTAGWKSMVFRRSPLYSTTTKTATA